LLVKPTLASSSIMVQDMRAKKQVDKKADFIEECISSRYN
jgi:hypothetical protein